jgi:MFS family permease
MTSGFRLWVAGATVSTLGDSVSFFALGWVAAAHGPGVASAVMTVESVPLCLLILVGGVIADRWGVRRVMIACDGFMAVVMSACAIGALHSVSVGLLLVVGLLSGTAAALRRPAAGVFPRLFVSGDDLSRALASATLAQQLARVAGPTAGGALLAAGGLSLTAGVDAASFVAIGLVLLAVVPPLEPTPSPVRSTMVRQLLEGLSAARRTPGAPATVAAVMGIAATVLPLVMLCVPLIGHERGWSAGRTGLVCGAWVLGGMAVMAWVSRRGMPGAHVAVSGPVVTLGGVVVLGTTHGAVPAFAALTATGVGTSLLTSRMIPRFLTATPSDLLARFQSLLGLAQTGPVLVSTPALGLLIRHEGVGVALACLVVVLALTPIAALRSERALPPPRIPSTPHSQRADPSGRSSRDELTPAD